MRLNHPHLLKMLDYSAVYEDGQYKIRGFYEIVALNLATEIEQRRDQLDYYTTEELRNILIDILEIVTFLKDNKMIHGDIRPEYIIVDSTTQIYKLADRLGDPSPPTKVQARNIKKNRNLYISPQLFFNLINQLKDEPDFEPIKLNPYMSEGYSIGLVMLEAGLLEDIQSIYDPESGQVLEEILAEKMDAFNARYEEQDVGLVRAIDDLLETVEEDRPDLHMLLTGLKSTPQNSVGDEEGGMEEEAYIEQSQEGEDVYNQEEDSNYEFAKQQKDVIEEKSEGECEDEDIDYNNSGDKRNSGDGSNYRIHSNPQPPVPQHIKELLKQQSAIRPGVEVEKESEQLNEDEINKTDKTEKWERPEQKQKDNKEKRKVEEPNNYSSKVNKDIEITKTKLDNAPGNADYDYKKKDEKYHPPARPLIQESHVIDAKRTDQTGIVSSNTNIGTRSDNWVKDISKSVSESTAQVKPGTVWESNTNKGKQDVFQGHQTDGAQHQQHPSFGDNNKTRDHHYPSTSQATGGSQISPISRVATPLQNQQSTPVISTPGDNNRTGYVIGGTQNIQKQPEPSPIVPKVGTIGLGNYTQSLNSLNYNAPGVITTNERSGFSQKQENSISSNVKPASTFIRNIPEGSINTYGNSVTDRPVISYAPSTPIKTEATNVYQPFTPVRNIANATPIMNSQVSTSYVGRPDTLRDSEASQNKVTIRSSNRSTTPIRGGERITSSTVNIRDGAKPIGSSENTNQSQIISSSGVRVQDRSTTPIRREENITPMYSKEGSSIHTPIKQANPISITGGNTTPTITNQNQPSGGYQWGSYVPSTLIQHTDQVRASTNIQSGHITGNITPSYAGGLNYTHGSITNPIGIQAQKPPAFGTSNAFTSSTQNLSTIKTPTPFPTYQGVQNPILQQPSGQTIQQGYNTDSNQYQNTSIQPNSQQSYPNTNISSIDRSSSINRVIPVVSNTVPQNSKSGTITPGYQPQPQTQQDTRTHIHYGHPQVGVTAPHIGISGSNLQSRVHNQSFVNPVNTNNANSRGISPHHVAPNYTNNAQNERSVSPMTFKQQPSNVSSTTNIGSWNTNNTPITSTIATNIQTRQPGYNQQQHHTFNNQNSLNRGSIANNNTVQNQFHGQQGQPQQGQNQYKSGSTNFINSEAVTQSPIKNYAQEQNSPQKNNRFLTNTNSSISTSQIGQSGIQANAPAWNNNLNNNNMNTGNYLPGSNQEYALNSGPSRTQNYPQQGPSGAHTPTRKAPLQVAYNANTGNINNSMVNTNTQVPIASNSGLQQLNQNSNNRVYDYERNNNAVNNNQSGQNTYQGQQHQSNNRGSLSNSGLGLVQNHSYNQPQASNLPKVVNNNVSQPQQSANYGYSNNQGQTYFENNFQAQNNRAMASNNNVQNNTGSHMFDPFANQSNNVKTNVQGTQQQPQPLNSGNTLQVKKGHHQQQSFRDSYDPTSPEYVLMPNNNNTQYYSRDLQTNTQNSRSVTPTRRQ